MTAETECGYEQEVQADAEWAALADRIEANHARLAAVAPKAPPYRVTRETTKTPGTGRYKVTKADGTVYYVTYGSGGMSCTCPDSRHRRPGRCKHCVFVAALIGKPELAKEF